MGVTSMFDTQDSTVELHYPKACASKAALADDVAEVLQRTGVIQTRQTGLVQCKLRQS